MRDAYAMRARCVRDAGMVTGMVAGGKTVKKYSGAKKYPLPPIRASEDLKAQKDVTKPSSFFLRRP